MAGYDLGRVFRDRRINAWLAWGLVVVLLIVSVQQAIVGDFASAVFALAVAGLGTIPAIRFGDGSVMLPWEVLLVASLPTIVRAFATWPVGERLASYLAVAAVALIVAVELHAFTPVRMTDSFAVLFVVVTTLAAAGMWAVVRYQVQLLTGVVLIESEQALMWEFVWSTVAGVVASVLLYLYFRREGFVERIPETAADQIVYPEDESS